MSIFSLFGKKLSTPPSSSPANTVDKVDLIKSARTMLFVGLSAAISYAINNVGIVDLGQYGPTLIPFITFGLDFAYRWLKDNTPKE
jgi:hypothetical protein